MVVRKPPRPGENKLNAAHLPRKVVQVVCCRATATQRRAYEAVLGDKRLRHAPAGVAKLGFLWRRAKTRPRHTQNQALDGKQGDVLSYIGRLQKICNHPCLLDAQPDADGGARARAPRGGASETCT